MSCLLLRLEGPLQSWGYRSRFSDRDTGREPTKSGVIGLLCCALGRDRSQPLEDLRALRMHVRVDREGTHLAEFQTAGAGEFRGAPYAAPKSSGAKGSDAILLQKHYLQDASFLVALEGPPDLLKTLSEALQDPHWPLSLGRKSCPPASPVFVELSDEPAAIALKKEKGVRFIWELAPGDQRGDSKNDDPVAWPDRQTRRYAPRYTREEMPEATP